LCDVDNAYIYVVCAVSYERLMYFLLLQLSITKYYKFLVNIRFHHFILTTITLVLS